MLGILGINYKTADLSFRETVARGAESLRGEKGLFFPHPTVLLSTCNRTEVYFTGPDLAEVLSFLLSHLRLQMEEPFEHRLYSYFGSDAFCHLCKVAAGLDSAIFAETEIQRQVKVAYAQAKHLSSQLHFAFQKALKVSKEIRSHIQQGTPSLYATLWRLAEWKGKRILLVGYSELNRGLFSFLTHKGIGGIDFCSRGGIGYDRSHLARWSEYDVVVCATQADEYLIRGKSEKTIVFDLSVPRNVDPEIDAVLYNIEEVSRFIEERQTPEELEWLIRERVHRLTQIYALKTQRVLESVGMGSHL